MQKSGVWIPLNHYVDWFFSGPWHWHHQIQRKGPRVRGRSQTTLTKRGKKVVVLEMSTVCIFSTIIIRDHKFKTSAICGWGEGSKICQRIVVKNCPWRGVLRSKKSWKFADVFNGWSLMVCALTSKQTRNLSINFVNKHSKSWHNFTIHNVTKYFWSYINWDKS